MAVRGPDFKSRVLKRHPDAAFQEVDGMAMVVLPARSEVQVLNTVGSRLWALIDGRRTVSEILEQMLREYETAPEQLERDVREFIDMLESRDMLLREEAD